MIYFSQGGLSQKNWPNEMVHLFVIDPHPLVAQALRYNIHSRYDGMKLVGSAINLKSTLTFHNLDLVDIFILNLNVCDSDPFKNINFLKERFSNKKIIIFTNEKSNIWIKVMSRSGADAYVMKDQHILELKQIIKKVYRGEKYFPNISNNTNGDLFLDSQIQIIKLLCDGISSKQITKILDIKYYQIYRLLEKAREQVNVKSNWALVAKIFPLIYKSNP